MSENVPNIRTTQDLALLTGQQLALIKNTIAKGATDEELHMFLEVARATGLNPFAKELYFIKYKMRNGTSSVAMPVGIDGLRRKAAESGDYAGQVGPHFCGEDGEWKDVWLSKDPPAACRVGVLRHGNPEPTWGIVKASEFAKDTNFWRDMPTHMLAVTAERHALRKAAPRLVEKIQAAGAQVMDADYLIAKGEQFERQRALPQQSPAGDLQQELYGQGPTGSEGDKKEEPVEWTKTDLAELKAAVEQRELSSKEWRELLGLTATAEVKDVVALGSVATVIKLLEAAFAKAVANEPVGQAKLGF